MSVQTWKASCQPDEESLEWNEMRQGVFTYWFCRGLEGAADLAPSGNGDSKVDIFDLQRAAILHSAAQLFASQGYHHASMSQLAQAL